MTTSCRVDIAEAYWGRHKKVVVSDVGPISGRGRDGIGPTSGLRWKQHSRANIKVKVVVFRRRADVGARAGWYRADIGP